ncbi:hypothetical protein LZZ90_08260 [Flavobacterium sp. SM15]|uniref:hypothetical protein n=1 Tax=Flavobacterium sp. SM15 TaxID=2908005 RepID=UPI001EDA3FDB|nr:hypothetical protein [Flavobacterium sp. SM15]MCG2611499.1 hypothetical protein [Flavobacterium sp. SM15]
MIKTTSKGQMFLPNVGKYKPFSITYDEIDNETIQLDIVGYGCINYFDQLDKEIELEINININNQLKDYTELTGHDSSEIEYSLNLKPTKILNRQYNTLEAGVEMSIVFKKPVQNASTYQLQPTIELISSMVLAEIFITQ